MMDMKGAPKYPTSRYLPFTIIKDHEKVLQHLKDHKQRDSTKRKNKLLQQKI